MRSKRVATVKSSAPSRSEKQASRAGRETPAEGTEARAARTGVVAPGRLRDRHAATALVEPVDEGLDEVRVGPPVERRRDLHLGHVHAAFAQGGARLVQVLGGQPLVLVEKGARPGLPAAGPCVVGIAEEDAGEPERGLAALALGQEGLRFPEQPVHASLPRRPQGIP